LPQEAIGLLDQPATTRCSEPKITRYFYGGAGNDYLEGRAGNDIYIFNRGDGQDTIYDYSPEGGNIDTIRFGAGITQNDIEFARNGNDVIITIKGTEDSIRLQASQFGFIWEIERFEFADGSVLLPSDIIYTIKGSPMLIQYRS
jgi:hypothetical protein